MSKFGIDVSQHNGNINWDIVKGQIDFAILRLGWIGNKNNHTIDTTFERNYNECKRLGIPVGVYVYCYSNNEDTARSGAEWTVNQLNGKNLELPVYIDMEDDTIKGKGKDILTNICIAFNTVIEQSGRWAGVYANRNWFDNYLHKDIIKGKYTTWIATYTSGTDKYKGEYDVWQNSSSGSVNGINGRVDTNYMYRDLISEINNTGSSEPQATKSIIDLANEVIAGVYGDGEARRQALGSLYNEVQAKVNEILRGSNQYYPKVDSGYKSIVDALNSIGVDSSFNNRKNIATKNGINSYKGTVVQNNQLLDMLKTGKLKM